MVMLLMMISPTVAENTFLWLAVAIRSLMPFAVAMNNWLAVRIMRVLLLAIVNILLLAIAID